MCAAPSSAYRTEKLHDGTTNANSVKADIAIPNATESVLKSRFYLDFLLNTERNGVAGFVGGCTIGSDNYYMHAEARRWTGRGRGPAGQNIQWFNDGGLNTLGIGIINNNTLQWANNVRFNITYRSAWYVNTIQFGIQFRVVGSGAWTTRWIFGENLMQQQQVTSNRLFDTGLVKDQMVQFRPIVVNAEGTFLSPIITTVQLDDNVYEVDAYSRTSACTEAGQTQVALWAKEADLEALPSVTTASSNTGIYLWKNIELTSKADQGWYMGMYETRAFRVDANGQVTHYQDCPASLPPINLSVEEDINGNMQVYATLGAVYSANVVITGRIDMHPSNATPDGRSFSITITQGNTTGTDSGFSMQRDPEATYYWQNVSASPAGFIIQKQEPI